MTSKKKHSPFTKDKKEAAYKRFMEFEAAKSIARDLNISYDALKYYTKPGGKWRRDRDMARLDLLEKVTAGKRHEMLSMADSCQTIVKRCLDRLAKQEEAPTIRDAKAVTQILVELDKILRLDENKPTEITEERPITTVEVKKKLALDPFSEDIIDVEEIKELPASDSGSRGAVEHSSSDGGSTRSVSDEGDR